MHTGTCPVCFSVEQLLLLLELYHLHLLKEQHPREDYRELLQLCLIFLGGKTEGSYHFRARGAIHNARLMMKGIYSLKMLLFRDQIKLTARERKGLLQVGLFVSLIYARYWHEATFPEKACANDLKLINLLQSYCDSSIKDKALKAIKRHLWYLSEHLVVLAIFDNSVSDVTKAAMVANLTKEPNRSCPC